jgi:signal transduction histidine kinase
MERNKQVFDFMPTRPDEIVTAVVDAMQAKFSSENCQFNCIIAENLPAVSADKDGIVTVLVNLLDNAYKYTNSEKKIELSVNEENGSVCFKVTDNGIGLSPRAQRKIFNRFYQVDSRLSRRAEGCGLGLSIVKFIVNAHKGSIEVTSSPGKSSVFTVKLPI